MPIASETPVGSSWPSPSSGGSWLWDSPRTSPLPVSVDVEPLPGSDFAASAPALAPVSPPPGDVAVATPEPVNDDVDDELPHAPARDNARASRIPCRSSRRTRRTRTSRIRATPRRECGFSEPRPERRISTRRWSVERLSRHGASRATARRRCRSERWRSAPDVRAADAECEEEREEERVGALPEAEDDEVPGAEPDEVEVEGAEAEPPPETGVDGVDGAGADGG
jgi:hypothetical protein